MKADKQFRIIIGFSILLVGIISAVSILLYSNFFMAFAAFLLAMLLFSTFDTVSEMKCKDPLALFNESLLSQRDSLVWYVCNAMHEFKSPAYYEIIIASFYDECKSLITDLARIKQIAEDKSRTDLIDNIQGQLEEFEIILKQLEERIKHIKSHKPSWVF